MAFVELARSVAPDAVDHAAAIDSQRRRFHTCTMFGFKRTKPVEVTPFAARPPRTFNTLWCDGVSARHLPSFAALMALHAELAAAQAQPPMRVLASLDELGQAGYTCGHTIEKHGLDDFEAEDGAQFGICLARLTAATHDIDLASFAGFLPWDDGELHVANSQDLLTANGDPDAALRIAREPDVLFQFVPVECAADALAAFPNGYFTSDLSPLQNHALARHLETAHGMELFGVGSRFLGFRRANPLDTAQAAGLADDVVRLYFDVPDGAAERLTALLTGRDWLLLRYTES